MLPSDMDAPQKAPRYSFLVPVLLGLILTIGGTIALRVPVSELPLDGSTAEDLIPVADLVRKTTLVGAALAVVSALFWTGSRLAMPAKIIALVAAGVAWGTVLRDDPWRFWLSLVDTITTNHEQTARRIERERHIDWLLDADDPTPDFRPPPPDVEPGPSLARLGDLTDPLSVVPDDPLPIDAVSADDFLAPSGDRSTTRLDGPGITWAFRPDVLTPVAGPRALRLRSNLRPGGRDDGDDASFIDVSELRDDPGGPLDDLDQASDEPPRDEPEVDVLTLPELERGQPWTGALTGGGLRAADVAEVVLPLRAPDGASLSMALLTVPRKRSPQIAISVEPSPLWQTLRFALPFGEAPDPDDDLRFVGVGLHNVSADPAPLEIGELQFFDRESVRARHHGRADIASAEDQRPAHWQSAAGAWAVQVPDGSLGRLRVSVMAQASAAGAPVQVSVHSVVGGRRQTLHEGTLFPGAGWRDIDLDLPPGTPEVELRARGLSPGTRVAWNNLRLVDTERTPQHTLLLVIDGLSWEMLGKHAPGITPWLDELSLRGLSAMRCMDPSNWSSTATLATVLTGFYGHGLGSDQDGFRLPDGAVTLAEAYTQVGRSTLAFGTAESLAADLSQGVDVYHVLPDGVPAVDALRQTVIPALSERVQEDWFAWIQLTDVLDPETPFTEVDAWLGALDVALAELDSRGKAPVIALVGGRTRPVGVAWAGRLPARVPVMITRESRGHIPWPVETLDVGQTLLDIERLVPPTTERPDYARGRSLAAMLRGHHANSQLDRSALVVTRDGRSLAMHGPGGVLSHTDGQGLAFTPMGNQVPLPSPYSAPERLADVGPHPGERVLEMAEAFLAGQRAILSWLRAGSPRRDPPLDALALAQREG